MSRAAIASIRAARPEVTSIAPSAKDSPITVKTERGTHVAPLEAVPSLVADADLTDLDLSEYGELEPE